MNNLHVSAEYKHIIVSVLVLGKSSANCRYISAGYKHSVNNLHVSAEYKHSVVSLLVLGTSVVRIVGILVLGTSTV